MPLILPGNVGSATAVTGFNVSNSLRFNSASNDHLNRTQTGGNRRKFTFSTWVKRCNPATRMSLFLANRSGSNYNQLYLNEDGYLEADFYHSGTQIFRYKTNALYRDTSAWYHMILAVDTEHDTASSRVRIYVNGLEVTSFSTETNPSENVDTHVNENSIVAYIGSDYNSNEPDYYLAETVMLDGTQATPTDFGEFDSDSGIWKPIDVSGLTFGTNGFYLDYKDSSALGNDAAGSNNFTVNNLTAIDQSTDTCTNNFATMNPLAHFFGTNDTFSNGNLTVATNTASGSINPSSATFGITKGKWYWEGKLITAPSSNYALIGIMAQAPSGTGGQNFLGGVNDQYGYASWNGTVYNSAGSTGNTTGGATYTVGDILSMAYDADNNRLYYYKNGAIQNSGTGIVIPTASDTLFGAWFPAVGDWDTPSHVWDLNFGSPPFAISSGNTDGNGYGNFEYAVPSGYYSLNTKNLSEYG